MGLSYCLVLAALASAALAFSGQYIPKSVYLIDADGHKSDVVYIRDRRDLQQIPLLRVRRGGGGGGGQSYASSSAQASSSAGGYGNGGGYSSGGGGGGGGAPANFADFIPDFSSDLANLADNIHSAIGSGGQAGASSLASASSSASSGVGSGYGNSGHAGGLGSGTPGGKHRYKLVRNLHTRRPTSRFTPRALGGPTKRHPPCPWPTPPLIPKAPRVLKRASKRANLLRRLVDIDLRLKDSLRPNTPVLFSRFGEAEGSGVQASGAAQGPQGAFSSTSTSSKDGKVKYSVQSGKY
ncbi:hypothetical protein NQ318_004376 [Aromia moschata]|uniref:Uncharacterized protein n=1 Tax=Aromia moschata TaxID=1265417 RepID=A0AAV8YSS3_9CUCU|nr:hypothetical protein NQ318_004376 [Aromia moschata]